MRTLGPILLPVLLLACDGDTEINIGNTINGDEMPTRAADEEVVDDLSSGTTLSNLDWAEALYCWPATENVNFNGSHVFFERTQGANRDFYLKVDPEGGVDVSVYAIQRSPTDTTVPPDLSSGQPNCEAGFDAIDDDNPGQAEGLYVGGNNDYSLLIGVAGANGDATGEFTLEIWDEPGPLFDTE